MPRLDTQLNGGCQHNAPTQLCVHAWAALRSGLDGVLSTASARPAGQDTRGFVVELLAWHPDWHSEGRQQAPAGNGDAMPQRTTADVMTHDGRRTRGHPRSTGVVTGGRIDGGNSAGVAMWVGAEEDLGEKALTGGSQSSVSTAR
jgi:hypothetical protein